jgi:HEAT repeat protein
MIDEATQHQILEYMEGNLSATESKRIEVLLETDRDAYEWYVQVKKISKAIDNSSSWEPGLALRESFHGMLEQEIKRNEGTRHLFFNSMVYRIAAAVLLAIIAGAVGFWYSKQQAKDAELLMVRKEIEATRKLVFNLLQNDLSPSQRIMGVKAAYEAEQKDDAIVNALIKVMNEDPNVNVRLSAMEALSKFSNEIIVRKALIESLHKQTDPVMQIALIQVLVQLKEKEAVQSLKEIIESEVVPESVKDEAYGGIIKLNS